MRKYPLGLWKEWKELVLRVGGRLEVVLAVDVHTDNDIRLRSDTLLYSCLNRKPGSLMVIK